MFIRLTYIHMYYLDVKEQKYSQGLHIYVKCIVTHQNKFAHISPVPLYFLYANAWLAQTLQPKQNYRCNPCALEAWQIMLMFSPYLLLTQAHRQRQHNRMLFIYFIATPWLSILAKPPQGGFQTEQIRIIKILILNAKKNQ